MTPSNANTSGLEKPEHMSEALFEVWRKIKPGPDYAPYRIQAAEAAAASAERRATAAEARADRLAKVMAGFGGLANLIQKNTDRDRVKIDGEWHEGPSATAYIQMIEEISLTARAALQQEG